MRPTHAGCLAQGNWPIGARIHHRKSDSHPRLRCFSKYVARDESLRDALADCIRSTVPPPNGTMSACGIARRRWYSLNGLFVWRVPDGNALATFSAQDHLRQARSIRADPAEPDLDEIQGDVILCGTRTYDASRPTGVSSNSLPEMGLCLPASPMELLSWVSYALEGEEAKGEKQKANRYKARRALRMAVCIRLLAAVR